MSFSIIFDNLLAEYREFLVGSENISKMTKTHVIQSSKAFDELFRRISEVLIPILKVNDVIVRDAVYDPRVPTINK